MLLLLFLFIIPSAVGMYFLLRPPIEWATEVEGQPAVSALPFKGLDEVVAMAAASNSFIRQQTANE